MATTIMSGEPHPNSLSQVPSKSTPSSLAHDQRDDDLDNLEGILPLLQYLVEHVRQPGQASLLVARVPWGSQMIVLEISMPCQAII